MPKPRHDDLPSIDPAALSAVTGGAGDFSSMLPMIMMMRRRSAPAAAAPPPPPPQPWKPRILVDGVEQPLTQSGGTFTSDG